MIVLFVLLIYVAGAALTTGILLLRVYFNCGLQYKDNADAIVDILIWPVTLVLMCVFELPGLIIAVIDKIFKISKLFDYAAEKGRKRYITQQAKQCIECQKRSIKNDKD